MADVTIQVTVVAGQATCDLRLRGERLADCTACQCPALATFSLSCRTVSLRQIGKGVQFVRWRGWW